KDWDLTEAEKLYREVLSKTRNVSLVEQCRARLRVIELADQQRAALPSEQRSVQDVLGERERQIDAEFERKRQALLEKYKGQFPRLIAIGEMRPMANKLEPVTHKLLKDGRMTHLLYSDTINLALYSGRTVGIEGTIDTSLKWPIPTIKVTGLVLNPDLLKGDEAEKPAPEDAPKTPAPADETRGTDDTDAPH
ncbi:MAG TPA: hypothetical protein VMY39_08550, partial [Planctomycetota bacterium]|nr:hypothetical protein [Planctomycetota bacterium]